MAGADVKRVDERSISNSFCSLAWLGAMELDRDAFSTKSNTRRQRKEVPVWSASMLGRRG